MNKIRFILSIIIINFSISNNVFAVGWTVEIEDVRVWSSDKVEIIVANPRSSNPAGRVWGCDYNLILIGDPVTPSMLSMALTAYVANKSIRIDVQGAELSCSINYIQTQKQ